MKEDNKISKNDSEIPQNPFMPEIKPSDIIEKSRKTSEGWLMKGIDKAINNRKKELDSLKKHDSGEKEIIPKSLQEIVNNMQPKEIEELEKIYLNWKKEPGTTNFEDIEILNNCYKQFISEHFIPKSKVREKVEKYIAENREKIERFDRYVLDNLLKDLDL